MDRIVALISIVLLNVVNAHAQHFPVMEPHGQQTPYIIHVTDQLTKSAEGQEALRTFHQRKAAGLLPRSHASDSDPSDIRVFKVPNLSSTPPTVDNIEFTLVGETQNSDPATSGFKLWVETVEWSGTDPRIGAAEVELLITRLKDATPAMPITGQMAGVMQTTKTIFGDIPSVEGDGIVDVLWLDVRDSYDPQSSPGFVAGFVTPHDLTSAGNEAEILYLDTHPLVTTIGTEGAGQTAAHELQHLINYNYDLLEETFVNEGLAEWSEIANGYIARGISYLSDYSRYNVPLYRWEVDEPYDDYERAGLFVNYFADRFGWQSTGQLSRDAATGSEGLSNSLAANGTDLRTLMREFHVANYINDRSLDAAYGYESALRLTVHAVPRVITDGSMSLETPETMRAVQPGGVEYVEWQSVMNLSVTVDAGGQDDVDAAVIRFDERGRLASVDLVAVDGSPAAVDGVSHRAILVLAGVNPDALTSSTITYSASWETVQSPTAVVDVSYDNGLATGHDGSPHGFVGLSGARVVATVFRPKSDAADTRQVHLESVGLAPFFVNQFANTGIPETAPRDATLYILADNGSRPGRTLYSKVILDSRLYQPVTSFALNHFTVDLSADPIGALPDTVHIALGDAGGDQNYLVLGPADYATENLSHFGEIGGPWARLWDIRLSGDNPDVLMDTVVPIRARFVLSTPITSAIAQQAVPAEVALEPNYPNPFNPNTTIRYHLPLSGHVRLQILDVLGRPVAVLADGPAEAGTHEAGFSGEQLSSGVYFYRLETNQGTRTRHMVLIK